MSTAWMVQSERLKSRSAFCIRIRRSVLPKRLSLSIFQLWPRIAHSASLAPAFGPVVPVSSRLSKPSEK